MGDLKMKNILQSEALTKYVLETSAYPREHQVLTELREATVNKYKERSLMSVPVGEGQRISMLLKIMNAKKTVEIGVFTGYPRLTTALALPHDGKVDVLKFLRQSNYWQRSAGRDHVIPMHHPNAFRFLREQEGIVHAKLSKILVGYKDVHYEQSYATGESIKGSSEGMQLSKFCLHPAGDTLSSCCLFDAIVSHCVPVIVSDKIELPYEDEIDYTQFSLFFSTKEALVPGYMVKQLRQFPKERWLEMWRQLKKIAHHLEYQYPPKKEDAVNMIWRQVKHKVPAATLAVHRSQRLKVPDWWRQRR